MSGASYDIIGRGYNTNRAADERIQKTIVSLLNLPAGKLIADIGAGTGNYTSALASAGYRLLAIEPSGVMLKQAVLHVNIRWITGRAEALPLRDACAEGIIIILAVHHFSDMRRAAEEAARVCPSGPLVMLTMDPRESEPFWFNDYFPEITQNVFKVFPPLTEVINTFASGGRWSTQVIAFPLPRDLADKNMCAGWGKPEMYLDPLMRQNTSGFALASQSAVQVGVSRLEQDLRAGRWDRLNGHLRGRESFDAGFRFLLFQT